MARNVDLTGKLGMGGKPTITIGDAVIEVNNGASDVLRMMELIGDSGELSPSAMAKTAELLLGKGGVKALDGMGLSFDDFSTVLTTAMELVTGSAEGEAEATPATT